VSRHLAVALALLLLGASRTLAQQPDTVPGIAAIRLRADTLRIVTPDAFVGAGRLAPRIGAATLAARWADSVRVQLAQRQERRWRAALTGDSAALAVPGREGAASIAALPGLVTEPADTAAPIAQGVFARYAELGIQLNALFDMRFERLKNLHCTAGDVSRLGSPCGGSINPPTITPQFGVRTGGVVGQRVHLNVDYDTQREFDASNNIQVYYQGLEDEILRRVEVGNVTFRPPPSRFINGGIPANNFGVAAQAQLGAMDFGVIYAQQKGNVVQSRVFTVGDQTVQPVDRFAADNKFERQRFFFVRNPRSFPDYPRIDVLNLNTVSLPDSIRITELRIYRHRSAINRPAAENNLSGLQAVALRTDSPQRAGPVTWEVLVEGRDYYLDPSGLWFALAARIDEQDFLAVSYVSANGDTTGTFPAEGAAGRVDTLELIYAPRTGPNLPTFYYEMRNVYRVGSMADVVRHSVQVRPVVGGTERPASGAPTFLALLGLAQSSDATTFDEYNRLFPRGRDPAGGDPMSDYFIVFPHLTPFADSTTLPLQYRTDSLYRTPTYLLDTQGPSPLYQIGLRYDAKGGDTRGSLQLGGYQIRQGSERVTLGGRQLVRDVDYTVNYEVGTVTFTNPNDLFQQPAQVIVQFEENAAFATAPTQILGLQGRYDLGDHGSINVVSLWQKQRTTFTRPPLGFEPASNLVMGVTGNFRFEPLRLTHILDALPLVRTEAPSLVTLDAELATSRPSPNQVGIAYVESFEEEAGQFISLAENSWEYGSRPSSPQGLGSNYADPALGFQDADAVVLTWQNLIAGANNQVVQLLPQQIDPSIVTQGSGQTAETVLWMALQPDTLGAIIDPNTFQSRWLLPHSPGPRWRSITEPLSSTGLDLSRVEYLEFWVLEDDAGSLRRVRPALVFDFGTVHEDAVDFWPTQLATPSPSDTVYSGRVRAGEGRLDTERDTLTATFNAVTDDNGILGDVADSILNATSGQMEHHVPLCQSPLSQGLVVYSWGSLEAHCTRRNGQVDTEDLDNDQHLDTLIQVLPESHLRYVLNVGDPLDSARYHVRAGGTVAGAGTWHLYRIPFRSGALEVGTPDIRQIKALRVTVVAPDAGPESTMTFALARMRLVGAPWVKRTSNPIAGIAGQIPEPNGEVVASVVTTENTDLDYVPPPGVVNQGAAVGGGVQFGSTQINEKSLRLLALDLRPGQRAEAFFRFPEGDRNFLGYRQLRVWARGRGNGWDDRELSFFVKVGQDEDNFYMYRTPARTTSWEPEVVVDFDEWFRLRSDIEQRFLSGQPPSGAAQCGGDTLAYVACSGPYVVHVRNPLTAPPNLTRVQELAVGMVRESALSPSPDTAELWVDDIRLSRVEDTPGMAGAVNLNVTAADIATITAGISRRDGNFRQLGENPSYTASNTFSLGATVRLERLGLERLGLTMPFAIRADRSTQDPYFLSGTDVFASGLSGLRRPGQRQTSYSVALRRSRRGTEWWQRALVDNVSLSGAWSSGSSTSELSQSSGRASDMRLDYQVAPADVNIRLLPGFLRDALGALPAFLREGAAIRGLRDGRLRLSPAHLSLSTGLTRTEAEQAAFRIPIAAPIDTAVPARSSTSAFRTLAGLDLRPTGSLALGLTGTWDRDLKDYGDSTTMGAVAGASRQQVLGVDIGFLRQRSLGTNLGWSPTITAWLRPRFSWSTTFGLSRDPNAPEPERTEGDTAGAFRLPTTFGNSAVADLTLPVDLSRAMRQLFRDSSVGRRVLDRVTQLDFSHRRETRSQYNQPGFDPGLAYQFGFGGLEGFRTQNGVFATQATRLGQDRITTSLRLPLSITLTGAYGWRATDAWYLRGERQQLQRQTDRDWPNLQGRWLWNPGGGLRKVLTTLNASLAMARRESASEFPSLDTLGTGLRFGTVTTSTPATLSFSWAPGLTTVFSFSEDESRSERSGNTTLGTRHNVGTDVRFAFRPPHDILPLRSDVRTALRWSYARNSTCIQRIGVVECLVIADSRRSEYNLTMDTDMPPNSNAGLTVGYVLTDDRHVNRKLSQFTLAISVRVYFSAGEMQ
jgi:motility/secretion related protein SprA